MERYYDKVIENFIVEAERAKDKSIEALHGLFARGRLGVLEKMEQGAKLEELSRQ